MTKFKSIGATRVANPKQLVFALDHDVQNTTQANLDKYASIEVRKSTAVKQLRQLLDVFVPTYCSVRLGQLFYL